MNTEGINIKIAYRETCHKIPSQCGLPLVPTITKSLNELLTVLSHPHPHHDCIMLSSEPTISGFGVHISLLSSLPNEYHLLIVKDSKAKSL